MKDMMNEGRLIECEGCRMLTRVQGVEEANNLFIAEIGWIMTLKIRNIILESTWMEIMS